MKIHLKGKAETRDVWLNGKKLSATKSQKVVNHSPDKFNWGYGGSGAAQLALSICLELFEKKEALRYYQNFKWKFIDALPQGESFDVDMEFEVSELKKVEV